MEKGGVLRRKIVDLRRCAGFFAHVRKFFCRGDFYKLLGRRRMKSRELSREGDAQVFFEHVRAAGSCRDLERILRFGLNGIV
jgi:hypothetical protein